MKIGSLCIYNYEVNNEMYYTTLKGIIREKELFSQLSDDRQKDFILKELVAKKQYIENNYLKYKKKI